MESTFTWIPLYTELARLLLDWEDRQDELIAYLDKLRTEGVKVTPLNDKDQDDASFLIKEIDPFTFFGLVSCPHSSTTEVLRYANWYAKRNGRTGHLY